MPCSGCCAPLPPGGTCRPATVPGKRRTSGFGAGPLMAPSSGCGTGFGYAWMRMAYSTSPLGRWIRPPCAPPKTPRAARKKAQCRGRRRGGLTSKRQVVWAGAGTPLALQLSAGQRRDGPAFEPLCEQVQGRRRPRHCMAGRGYEALPIRRWSSLPPSWATRAHRAATLCAPQRGGTLLRLTQRASPRGQSRRQTRPPFSQQGLTGL